MPKDATPGGEGRVLNLHKGAAYITGAVAGHYDSS